MNIYSFIIGIFGKNFESVSLTGQQIIFKEMRWEIQETNINYWLLAFCF